MIKKTVVALAIVSSMLLSTGCGKKEVTQHNMITLDSGEISPKVKIGSTLEIELKDQFDKAHQLTDETKKVAFAFTKVTGHLITDFLDTQDKDFLATNKMFYVADVSRMPSVILDYAVLPGIKKLNYPVILFTDETIADNYKSVKNPESIMIVTLDNKKIIKVDFLTNIDDFQKAIK